VDVRRAQRNPLPRGRSAVSFLNWNSPGTTRFGVDGHHRAPAFSDPLQEHLLGRRGAIAVACVLTIAATIGQSFSRSIVQIIGCRIISGLALAAKASSAPLLTAEVAPNHLRGKTSLSPKEKCNN
jgi:MFS family permease